ncbi:MAG: hypothetical protein A2021_08835 [Elusimicrobia bacterium GWF2_52_66]|nr:MAG: hypothetical protein A2X33_02405 [Elusimicrobia bacterium GWA2_51_34]OGR88333.1 MAG: hypothetical protein A2021_08835 [Elusimicrobia bacterium GWF2_52_66]
MNYRELLKDKARAVQTAGIFMFSAALPFSVTFIQGGILLFMAAGLWRRWKESNIKTIPAELSGNPLAVPWAVYFAAGLLAALAGINPAKSIVALNSDLLTFVSFAALCLFLEPEQRGLAVKVYLTSICVAAILGAGQSVYGLINAQDIRAHATSHPVRLGEIMIIGLALALSRLSAPETLSPRVKKVLYATALIILSTIILSQTRGAYLGAAFVFASLLIIRKPPKRVILAFVTAALILGAAISSLNPEIHRKISSIYGGVNSAVNSGVQAPDQSVNTRLILWKTGFAMIKDRPVLGAGPSNVKRLFPAYCAKPYPEDTVWGSLHNIYIHQAAERGLVGLGALFLLFGGMFVTALRSFRARPSDLTLWALAVMPAWFVMNMTEISFQHVHTSYAVFFALAVSITVAKPKGY